MTYHSLLKRLSRLTLGQLGQEVKLFEGCSGNVTKVTEVLVNKDLDLDDDKRILIGDVVIIHDN